MEGSGDVSLLYGSRGTLDIVTYVPYSASGVWEWEIDSLMAKYFEM
jgi:hypothetical protein